MASSSNTSFLVSATGQSATRIGPSQLLAQLRKTGNNKLCDIELVVEGRKEYVHSAVVAVHSKLFYRLINTEQSPPFSIDLHHLAYDSVRSIIDWMYFGEAKFSGDIASHLAVAAYFEVATVHSLLEQQLIRLGMNPATAPAALAVCANEKTKVSSSTASLIVDCLLSAGFQTLPLTTATAKYLLARDEANLKRKARVVSLVLRWLALHRDQADAVLEHLQNIELSDADEQAFIGRLGAMVRNKEDVRVEVDARRNTLAIVSGLAAPRSEKDMVSMASGASPAQSEMEVHQHMAYSPLSSMKRELDNLPDVFKQINTPTSSSKKEKKASAYPQYVERPPGFLPPTFRGHVDMPFAAVVATPAKTTESGASRARTAASNTNTYSYNPAEIPAFTAESVAEISRLPDMFARKPSDYRATPQKQQQQYVTPARNVSSVYAEPYGPSYAEGQQSQPYLQQQQQPKQQQQQQPESMPLPVKLELPGGAVVIPHAAHPMLPFSHGFVEVRLPNQPSYPSNFPTEYSQSRFKTSEYAGQF